MSNGGKHYTLNELGFIECFHLSAHSQLVNLANMGKYDQIKEHKTTKYGKNKQNNKDNN